MKQKALTREERKGQILLTFWLDIQGGGSGELTIAAIAKLMHLTPSTKLRNMVMELVIDGVLDFRDEEIPGIAKFRRLYSPNPKTFKRPKVEYKGQGRAIKINSRQSSFLAEI